ncbi:MAG: hypothetical protein O2892_19450 [Actinomycetota bacterium]|nr:hypothetical protein [Actinomycetota bacterium]MDA2951179.1 hypothetical protein [Actinomycetota bacterium]
MSTATTDEWGPVPQAPPTSTRHRRRRLTQKPAAFTLGALMLAVPLVPTILDATLPQRPWDPAETSAEQVLTITDGGNIVVVETPKGWEALDQGDTAVLRGGDSRVLVEAYDLGQRDPVAVAERLIRLHRIEGIASALDGGSIASSDGTLAGQTCVVVTQSATGTCAFLHDDEVIISVVVLSHPGQPAPPIDQVVDLITRQSQ